MDMNPNGTLHSIIQGIIQNTINNVGLPEVAIGTVETINPLSIRISPEILLPSDVLLLTETVCYKQVDLTHTHPDGTPPGLTSGATVITAAGDNSPQGANIMINRDLQIGDKVVMLSAMGGQQYIVFSKVASE